MGDLGLVPPVLQSSKHPSISNLFLLLDCFRSVFSVLVQLRHDSVVSLLREN
jgi:hypothetical protein